MESEYEPFIMEWKPTLRVIQDNIESYVHDFRECAGARCPHYCSPKHELNIKTALAWELRYIVMFLDDRNWTVESCFDRIDSLENAISYHSDEDVVLNKLAENVRQVTTWIRNKSTKEDVIAGYNGVKKVESITSKLLRVGSESESE